LRFLSGLAGGDRDPARAEYASAHISRLVFWTEEASAGAGRATVCGRLISRATLTSAICAASRACVGLPITVNCESRLFFSESIRHFELGRLSRRPIYRARVNRPAISADTSNWVRQSGLAGDALEDCLATAAHDWDSGSVAPIFFRSSWSKLHTSNRKPNSKQNIEIIKTIITWSGAKERINGSQCYRP